MAKPRNNTKPTRWANSSTLMTDCFRVASPPLKSPAPHDAEANKPNATTPTSGENIIQNLNTFTAKTQRKLEQASRFRPAVHQIETLNRLTRRAFTQVIRDAGDVQVAICDR